jgi:aspartyl-tRNA(Asn)/glutamyl-tRNA(Gln) amidotransferase subunit A
VINLTATEIAEKVRKREISAVEVAAAFLARIKNIEPKIKAFITVFEQEALAQAA